MLINVYNTLEIKGLKQKKMLQSYVVITIQCATI